MNGVQMRRVLIVLLAGAALSSGQAPEEQPLPAQAPNALARPAGSYELGPGDEITVRGVEMPEISDKPVRIDTSGFVSFPLIGRVRAAGLTVEELEASLAERLKAFLVHPELSVAVTDFRSQPVSVLGAVRSPGVYQLRGSATLVEVLSLAGGTVPEIAGSTVNISRRLAFGRIPLESARDDATGEFSIADVDLNALLRGTDPGANIFLKPHDVITVPKADLVYVMGQVQRAGGFVLEDRAGMSLLEALSRAGGIAGVASPQNSRILRVRPGQAEREEIPVNVKAMLSGSVPDVMLQPDDILFVPTSAPKHAALRAVEAAIQIGTGVVIWRR